MNARVFDERPIPPRDGFLSRGKGRALWRKVLAPVAVIAGIATVEIVSTAFPGYPEAAPVVLVAVVIAGFVAGLESGVLSSSIAVAYALFIVAGRHSQHDTEALICVHAVFLATAAPALGIMAGALRNKVNHTAETLQNHLGNTPLGVIEMYGDFEIRIWAGSAESIFGFKSKDVVGKNLFDLPGVFFGDDDSDEAKRVLEELGKGDASSAVHHSRSEGTNGLPGHSRWFWSSTLESGWKESRYLVLVEDITERVHVEEQLEKSKSELIDRLVRAVECRDDKTGFHIIRISLYCEALGRAGGLSQQECKLLRQASPMHDIGKIGIPDRILLKAGKLDEDELAIVREHPIIGANILTGSDHSLIEMAEQIALTHHEKWNGTGYPNGLEESDIPLAGRICAVCDVFDALVSSRPYKQAWSLEEASTELKNLAGNHLDPQLVDLFLGILPEIEVLMADYSDDTQAMARPRAS